VHRLLVMSCGKRKRSNTAPLPALERYDGPAFHVLRRYLATHPATPPDIYILSARFGLIPADRPIPYYDQRLTPQRAAELRPTVRDILAGIFAQRSYEQIYLAVGRDYAQALDDYAALVPKATSVLVAHGSQGKRLAQLHDWLYGPAGPIAPKAPQPNARRADQHRSAPRLRGVEISLTGDQALARARQALAFDSHGCDRFHSWYVVLDGKRIAPKWLVSQLTGLPAGAFTTHEALRALAELGIAAHRSEVL
jgi:hypothetical protein